MKNSVGNWAQLVVSSIKDFSIFNVEIIINNLGNSYISETRERNAIEDSKLKTLDKLRLLKKSFKNIKWLASLKIFPDVNLYKY